MRKTTDQFIIDAKKVHGEIYNYSLVNYINNHTKVTIICSEHGLFYKSPHKHIGGQGCPKCSLKKLSKSYSKTTEDFINDAKKVHGDKYDYSLVNYINNNTKINIICGEHGVFSQLPTNHLSNKGCLKCSYRDRGQNSRYDTTDLITKFNSIHKEKYDYSNLVYKGIKDKIDIICKKHGVFKQTAECHLHGNSCPKCKDTTRKKENSLKEYIESLGLKILSNNRTILSGKELDIFIPDRNIAFEFNGLYWHSELRIDKDYHLNKTNQCKEKGINLIHIFEDEWDNKKEIVISRITNLLHMTENRIYARKCILKEISSDISTKFFDENHLQGKVGATIKIGLFYEDRLVSSMLFNKPRLSSSNDNYELVRFANIKNTNVIGGASKLLNYFIKKYKPKSIISFADKRWSNGFLYEKLGFTAKYEIPPDYFYIKDGKRRHKSSFKKKILVKEGFDSNKSEHEIMFGRGLYRIYDCGKIKYELTIT